MKALDVVYIVRPGEDNEELRHSLRSVAKNLPHNRIVIAGYTPSWVRNVYSIPTDQSDSKYQNAEKNWLAAMNDESITDDFIAMNDDFYIVEPITVIPTLHRGDLESVIGYYAKYPGPYISNMRRTRDLLTLLGRKDLKSYALHTPMVMNKLKRRILQEIINLAGYEPHQVQMRTLYGNFWDVGGEEMADVKTSVREHKPKTGRPFISSNDSSFNDGATGDYIKAMFNERCRYEA